MAKVFGQEEEKPKEESTLPEQLRGKTAEEIYELTRQEHERVVNEIKAKKFDESNKAQEQKPKPQAPRIPGQPPRTAGQGQGGTPPSQSHAATTGQPPRQVRYWEDPEGFMDQQLNQRIAPLVQTQVQALRGTNKTLFKQQVGTDKFAKYEDEVEQFVDALSPQLQADPRAYEQAYKYVQAQHLDEIIREETEKSRTAGLADALADAGLEPEQIAAIVSKAGGNGEQQAKQQDEPEYRSSLFQPNTGIPRTASGSQSASAGNTATAPKKGAGRYTQEERRMMEEFEMSPQEWDAYKAENSDTFSALKGE